MYGSSLMLKTGHGSCSLNKLMNSFIILLRSCYAMAFQSTKSKRFPGRSWAWSSYIFLQQLLFTHLFSGQVLLQPGMSRRTFFLDPAFVLYSITEKKSQVEAGCAKTVEVTRPAHKHHKTTFPDCNFQNSGTSSWSGVKRFLSQQQPALITLNNKTTQNLLSSGFSVRKTQKSLELKHARLIQSPHFMSLDEALVISFLMFAHHLREVNIFLQDFRVTY